MISNKEKAFKSRRTHRPMSCQCHTLSSMHCTSWYLA